jgi:UDP-3-O-[3-hydroxymyristoyl] glucosamine N-acyltransferase
MPIATGEIAAFIGAAVKGEAKALEAVAPLDRAGPSQLSFFANAKYLAALKATRAGAVICSEADAAELPQGCTAIISRSPYRDWARVVARWFETKSLPEPGVHPQAFVHPSAFVGEGVRIGAGAVVEAGASIGQGSVLFPLVVVGHGVKIGADCRLYPQVTLYEGCQIGDRVIIHAGSVLGSDGFGFAPDPPAGYVKVPQVGGVVVEDDVEIQSNTCIDRGALGPTVIRKGAKIDNLVHISHNVEVGPHNAIAALTGVAGSTKLGNWVTLAAQSGVAGHLTISDQVIVTAQAGVAKDPGPKAVVTGTPAQPLMTERRNQAELGKLGELRKKVRALEARLAELEKKIGGA